jgi:hypothetical protein
VFPEKDVTSRDNVTPEIVEREKIGKSTGKQATPD